MGGRTTRGGDGPSAGQAKGEIRAEDGDGLTGRVKAWHASAGNRAMAQTVQRRVGATRVDPAAPENTRVDCTGRYEPNEVTRGNRVMLQLNQAGRHIEGWWQRHVGQGEGRAQTYSRYRLRGELQSDGPTGTVFAYTRATETGAGTSAQGTLTARNAGDHIEVELREGSWSLVLHRYSTRSRLSDSAIASMPAATRGLVRSAETTPLDEGEEALLRTIADDLGDGARRYLATSRQNIARLVVANNLSGRLADHIAPIGREQRPVAIRRLRSYLLQEQVTGGQIERPVWDWLQVMVTEHAPHTQEMQAALGLSPRAGQGDGSVQHRYRYRTSIVGLGAEVGVVGLGGYLGVFVMEKLAPDRFTQRYFTVVGNVSAGIGAGVNVGQTSAWSEFSTINDWRPSNFNGTYSTMSAQAGGAAVVGAGYQPGGLLIFYGDGSLPELAVPADGAAVLYGLQIGADVGLQSGYLHGGRQEAIRAVGTPQQRPVTSEGSYGTGQAVHFAVNDPSLNELGRAAMRETVALHRAAFESAGSTLRVDGYASPTGREARNTQLADLRAQNVLQAIRDALGASLRVPPANISWQGHGAEAARQAGAVQGVETETWRRVNVTVNGRVIVTLH